MLKKSASIVLASFRGSEVLEDMFRSPRSISRANGHTKCGWYLLASSLAAALPGTRRVSARQGWAGEKSGHFEHPASSLPIVSELWVSEVPVYRQSFLKAF
jgi:hypothetical protein